MSREKFANTVNDAILSLPDDLKVCLRVVEDADVDEASRVALAGAILRVLSGANTIPGMRGILAYVGDVLVIRIVLERAIKSSAEAMSSHQEDSPELFGVMGEQMATAREYLGELMQVLDGAVDGLAKVSHQGHSAKQCVVDTESSTWLYDAVHEAVVETLEFDEDDVSRETKNVDQILPHLKSRLEA